MYKQFLCTVLVQLTEEDVKGFSEHSEETFCVLQKLNAQQDENGVHCVALEQITNGQALLLDKYAVMSKEGGL